MTVQNLVTVMVLREETGGGIKLPLLWMTQLKVEAFNVAWKPPDHLLRRPKVQLDQPRRRRRWKLASQVFVDLLLISIHPINRCFSSTVTEGAGVFPYNQSHHRNYSLPLIWSFSPQFINTHIMKSSAHQHLHPLVSGAPDYCYSEWRGH